MKVIDAHFHIWDVDVVPITWLKNIERLNQTIGFDALEAAYKDVEFVGGIYIESASDDFMKELSYIRQQQQPKILGICTSKMQDDDHFVSFREVLHVHAKGVKRCLEEDFLQLCEQLTASSLPFEACLRGEDLMDFNKVLQQFPDLKVVINHMGNPQEKHLDDYAESIKHLSSHPHCVIKLSAPDDFSMSTSPAFVKQVLQTIHQHFGCERVLFGSNFPVSYLNPMSWMDMILNSQLFDDRAFYQNAVDFYRLHL